MGLIRPGHSTRLSANDCFCLVAARCWSDSILLTGDNLLRRVAGDDGVRVHGVLWAIDELDAQPQNPTAGAATPPASAPRRMLNPDKAAPPGSTGTVSRALVHDLG